MSLKALLEENRAAILARWTGYVIEAYPADTAVFLRKQRDRFANPVGHAIHTGIEALFEALLAEAEPEAVRDRLDDLLRIRAVQHLGPVRSLEFLFRVKDAVRVELGAAAREPAVAEALLGFERRVDTYALLGFEVYSRCREQIYELRLAEIRNHTMDVKEKLLRKRGKWPGPPADELLLFPDGRPGEAAPLATLETDGERPRQGASEGAPSDESGAVDAPSSDDKDKPTAE